MNKKLPSVSKNVNVSGVDNNLETFYSKDVNVVGENEGIKTIIVNKKINDLFNSESFVYKVNVIVTTLNGDVKKTLIARNNEYLLTIDNEKILIKDIIDIRKV